MRTPEDQAEVTHAEKLIALARIMLEVPDGDRPPLSSVEWWEACRYANRLVAAGIEAP